MKKSAINMRGNVVEQKKIIATGVGARDITRQIVMRERISGGICWFNHEGLLSISSSSSGIAIIISSSQLESCN